MTKLFLIHGFIGAGKTTFAKKLAAETKAIRFTSDEWMHHFYGDNPPMDQFAIYEARVKDMIWRLAEDLLRARQDVVLDFGFWRAVERREVIDRAASLGATPIFYKIETPFDLAWQRVQKRNEDLSIGALMIDRNAFENLQKNFEPMGDEEDFILVDHEGRQVTR